MDKWTAGVLELLRLMTGRPEGDPALWGVFAAGAVAALLMMGLMAGAMNNNNSNPFTNLIVLAVGGGAMLLAAVGVRILVFPDAPSSGTALGVTAGAAALALFVIAIPVFCLVQRVKFLSALVSLVVSLAVGGLALFGAGYAYDTFKGGKKGFDRTEQRTDDINKELNR